MAEKRALRRIAGRDAVWLQDSPENLMVINAVFTLDPIHLEALQKIFGERLYRPLGGTEGGNSLARFSQRVVYRRGRPYWQDDEGYDVARHVFLAPPVAEDPDVPFGREELQAYIKSLASTPLPADRPLWQIQLIPRFTSDRSALYVRIHHVMADGISLLPVVFSVMDRGEDDEEDLEREARAMNKPKNTWWILLKTVLWGPFLLIQKLLWWPDRNPLHGPKLSGTKRVAWTRPIDVDHVKEVKDAFGATVNDVLMSCVTGAFERYVRERSGERLRRFRVSMPINVRSVDEKPKMENKFAAVLFGLPVGHEDPEERLRAMNERLARLKSSVEPIFTYGIVRLMLALLPLWMSRLLIDFLANKCTCVISNVPGPRRKISLAGRSLRTMLFWVPQRADVGIGISMMSFSGRLYLGAIADTALVEDPAEIVRAFEKEFEALRGSVDSGRMAAS